MLETSKRLTEEEIVLETIHFYMNNPRAISKGVSKYIDTDGTMCAIGRCLKPKFVKKLRNVFTKFKPLVLNILKYERKDSYLSAQYRGHSLTFWANLQELHDNDDYWDLTDFGNCTLNKQGLNFIKLKFGLTTWGDNSKVVNWNIPTASE